MAAERLNELKEKILASKKITEEELTKKIHDKMESLGSLISEEGAAHIIANELGVTIGVGPTTTTPLAHVVASMRSVSVLVRVLKKYELRTFGDDGSGKVGSLFVGDATGFSRLTFWNDKTSYFKDIQEGDVLEIQNAYSRENNGRVEIHMGTSSHCIINPKDKNVTVKERPQQQPEQEKKLNDITDKDSFVTITATIVQAYDPRFFESCPQCNKRMREEDGEFACATHGKQTPVYNYVMNLFLDDGSANLRATVWKEQIHTLLGKPEKDVLELRTNQDLLEQTKTDLLGKIIRARARVKTNENFNTLELVLYSLDPDPKPPGEVSKKKTKDEPTTQTSSQTQEEHKEPSKKDPNTPSPESVDEELVKDDDEELLSIDDLDDEL